MSAIDTRPLFTLRIDVDPPPHVVGAVPQGYTRRFACIAGGTFVGERLSGRVLPGGADVMLERADGALQLDVRLLLQTDAGELIYLTYGGRRVGDYFRSVMQFETASPGLAWLNNLVAVAKGKREPSGPVYEVYEVM